MQNQDKPTPSIANSAKTSFGETWDTVTTTWATETRTWGAISKLITNSDYNKSGIGYLITQIGGRILQQNGFRLIINKMGLIVNEDKP